MKKTIRKMLGDKVTDKLGYVKYLIVEGYFNLFVSAERREKMFHKKRLKLYGKLVSEGELCFDVGANVGNRIAPLLEVGARVVAVEPQESCYTVLREKFGNKIELVTDGLGAAEGEKDFYVSDLSVISTFSEEWKAVSQETGFKIHEWKEVRRLKITTLDNLIKIYGRPSFVKIDVEGFEGEVLKGLSSPVKYLSFEYMTVNDIMIGKALDCVKRLMEIDKDVKFNYAVAENMKLIFSEWVDGDVMSKHVKEREFQRTGFGDIYAHYEVKN